MEVFYTPLEHGSPVNVPALIVVHAMGEYILDPDPIHAPDFLEKLGLSAHVLVAPNGDIYSCRDTDEGAWHARGYNKNSLGIEFLVEGEHDYGSFLKAIKNPWVKHEQLESGVTVVRTWLADYDIEKVVRHSDISPGRKVDPGEGFPWPEFNDLIKVKT